METGPGIDLLEGISRSLHSDDDPLVRAERLSCAARAATSEVQDPEGEKTGKGGKKKRKRIHEEPASEEAPAEPQAAAGAADAAGTGPVPAVLTAKEGHREVASGVGGGDAATTTDSGDDVDASATAANVVLGGNRTSLRAVLSNPLYGKCF